MAPGLVNWMKVGELAEVVTEPITRPNTQVVIVENAKNEFVYNLFSYGQKNLLVNLSSEDTLAVNLGSDYQNEEGAQLVNENASMVVINSLRYNGHSYDNTNGTMKLYNRITVDYPDEQTEIVGKEK